MEDKFKRQRLNFLRWVFRVCGGFHRSEHDAFICAEKMKSIKHTDDMLNEAEQRHWRSTAELRLQVHTLEDRQRMLTRMLNAELAFREETARSSRE